MATYSKKQLAEQVEIISVVKALTAVSVLRLAEANVHFESTKKQLEGIEKSVSAVFEINSSEATNTLKQVKYIRKKKSGLIAKPLSVFVSSNQELYGDLIVSIGKLFVDDLKMSDGDALVIGRVGKIIVEKEHIINKVMYFDIEDDKPDLRMIQKILMILEKYDKVVVYYGINEDLLRQVATKSVIAKEIPNIAKPAKKYFFEPTPDDVLDFLQVQISNNSFHQKMFLSQIARLSAKRWAWTKQQLARSRMVNTLLLEHKNYRRELTQKQQQVALSAQRINKDNIIQVRH